MLFSSVKVLRSWSDIVLIYFSHVWISLYTFTAQIFQLIFFSKSIGLKRCLKVFIHVGKARTILQIFTWATLRFSFLKMFTENVI